MSAVQCFEDYLDEVPQWRAELVRLREILLEQGLEETIKWGRPVYVLEGKNVVGLAGFKAHFCLWFFHGDFLPDPHKKLTNAQEGKTKSLRQMRFQTASEVSRKIIVEYVREAVKQAKSNRVSKREPKKELPMPIELQMALQQNRSAWNQFQKLTPSCRREYCEYILEAKQESTRLRRVEKILPMIQGGAGLNDKYRSK